MSGPIKRGAMFATAIIVVTGFAAHERAGRAGNEAEASSNTQDSVRSALSYADGPCYHTDISRYVCPDSQLYRSEEIASVLLTVVNRAGQRRTIELPRDVDAILLTKASVEKFLLSYYWAVDREKAVQLSRQIGGMH